MNKMIGMLMLMIMMVTVTAIGMASAVMLHYGSPSPNYGWDFDAGVTVDWTSSPVSEPIDLYYQYCDMMLVDYNNEYIWNADGSYECVEPVSPSASVDICSLNIGDTVCIHFADGTNANYIVNDSINDATNQYFGMYASNTPPIINSISPDNRIELVYGMKDRQVYTSNVTDEEGDAIYSWRIDGVEVGNEESYIANYDDISVGIHTLTLNVSDEAYSDAKDMVLEIRARGGSSSQQDSTTRIIEENSPSNDTPTQESRGIIGKIIDLIRGIFNRLR